MWAGIAGSVVDNGTKFEIAISVHDSIYNTDFASSLIPYDSTEPEIQASEIEKHVLSTIRNFSREHLCKFLGAGVTLSLLKEVCNHTHGMMTAVTDFCVSGSQSVHSYLVGVGHRPHCVQYQAFPHRFYHSS